MKAKHHGLFSISFILLAIGISILYYATDSWKLSDVSSGRSDFQPLPLFPEPTPMELNTMDQLSPKIKTLINPPILQRIPSDLRLLGYVNPHSYTNRPVQKSRSTRDEKTDFLLSFTFSSGVKRFCILDDIFYQEGDLLPDSSRIVTIQTRKVLLEKNGIQNWINIDTQPVGLQQELPNKRNLERTAQKEKK